MPTRWGMPDLYEAVPFPRAPRFFVRVYDTARNTIQGLDKHGQPLAPAMPIAPDSEELLIWGYSCRSTYEEDDWPTEDEAFRNQRNFPSMCFSRLEPDGEYGFTPIAEVQEIEREALELALSNLGVDWIDPQAKLKPLVPARFEGEAFDKEVQRRILAATDNDETRATLERLVEQDPEARRLYEEAETQLLQEKVVHEAVRNRLVTHVDVTLDDLVAQGLVRRLPKGRYQALNEFGKPVGPQNTVEWLTRQMFPQFFNEGVRGYQQWEDAMVAQARLYEFTASADGREYLEEFQADMNTKHPLSARLNPGFIHAVQMTTLAEAEPIWVSHEMVELIDHARDSFEVEEVRPSDPFVPSGFALLGQPLMLHDAPWVKEQPGRSVDGLTPVRAVGWMSVHSEDLSQGAFWLSFYNHIDDDPGHHQWGDSEREQIRRHFGPLMLGHMFQWTWGTKPVPERLAKIAVEGEDPEQSMFRATEQAQMIQTIWRLCQQFIPAKRRAPRGIRRDAQRKMQRQMDDINVVILRRTREDNGDAEETGRHVTVTTLVNGYWSHRHKREGLRQVWVRPHLRGQGPLKKTKRAWIWER